MFSAATKELITTAAILWKLDPYVLLSVVEVESGGKTHAVVNGQKEALIRFKAQCFRRRLNGRKLEAASLADLKASIEAGAQTQSAQWRLLRQAMAIDKKAAYEATAWGVGQVPGAFWAWLGYSSTDALVRDACSGIHGQLSMMMCHIEKADLLGALRERNWADFARGYNGRNYAREEVPQKLTLAYQRYAKSAEVEDHEQVVRSGLRLGDFGDDVHEFQSYLAKASYNVIADGVFDPVTFKALKAFQKTSGLESTGIACPQTMQALKKTAHERPT